MDLSLPILALETALILLSIRALMISNERLEETRKELQNL